MKIQFFLVTLFATICFIEAHKLKLKFVSVFNELESTTGTATLTLIGAKEKKKIIFGHREFTHYNEFEIEDEMNEDIESVYVLWETESKKPLVLLYLMVYVDDSKELINFYMTDTLQSGEGKNYKKN